MAKLTRRGFIAGSAGAAGLAAAGALGAGRGIAKLVDGQTAAVPRKRRSSTTSEPVVAYVRDAARGEVGVLVGHREVKVNDPTLVAHILDAAG